MTTPSASAVATRLVRHRIVPVAVIDAIEDAVPLARALAGAGLPVIEVTLRTECAIECIRTIRQACPDVLVGAGTVLTPAQVGAAVDAGAEFGVSPGLSEHVVRAAGREDWVFMPGVATPSEVERALHLDLHLLKFFPAEPSGGVKMLKALAGPYEHAGVRFVPLGGIAAANMGDYLALPVVAAVGGSWVCERKTIREKRWEEIGRLANQALALVPSGP